MHVLVRSESEFIREIYHRPQGVSTLASISYFIENFPDLVLDCIRGTGTLFERGEVREQFVIDEIEEVVSALLANDLKERLAALE